MAITEGQAAPGEDLEQSEREVEDPREAWLEAAALDADSGLSALATAARRGRPLRRD